MLQLVNNRGKQQFAGACAVQLYSFCFSSTSYRVRIALSLKGIDYDYAGVNLRAGEQRSESYIQLNPAKGVPVLITDAGDEISQSMAIHQHCTALPEFERAAAANQPDMIN